MNRVFVITGGRDYTNKSKVREAILNELQESDGRVLFILGGARGVDTLADEICRERQLDFLTLMARWDKEGRQSAGPKRNSRMISQAQQLMKAGWEGVLLSFPGGTGTKDCTEKGRAAGLRVVRIEE